jgi:hypothetical protein
MVTTPSSKASDITESVYGRNHCRDVVMPFNPARYPNHARSLYRWVFLQHELDLGWIDSPTSALDNEISPPLYCQMSVLIYTGSIARADP